jgi:predicted ester cyclase
LARKCVANECLPPTKAGTLEMFKAFHQSFPDFAIQLDDLIAEGDKVFVGATMTGTHEGEFMGIPATGKQISEPIADLLRVRDGKAVEHWGVTDSGAMMQQLGAVEIPGQ